MLTVTCRSQFIPGAYFDLRVELHAYDKNTSNPTPEPYTNFKTLVRKDNGKWKDADEFFQFDETPALEKWNFSWIDSIETAYAEALNSSAKPIDVAVTARIWRKLKFDEPGTYEVAVQYGPKDSYIVRYTVIEVSTEAAKPYTQDYNSNVPDSRRNRKRKPRTRFSSSQTVVTLV